MVADPDSTIIQAYGVLNPEAAGMQKGFARPGYFFIDSTGVIREKFFEPERAHLRQRNYKPCPQSILGYRVWSRGSGDAVAELLSPVANGWWSEDHLRLASLQVIPCA